MADVDVVFRSSPRYFYREVATATERQRIDAIIKELCEAPDASDQRRYAFDSDPTIRLYEDTEFWITYRMLNDWTLSILGIGTVEDRR